MNDTTTRTRAGRVPPGADFDPPLFASEYVFTAIRGVQARREYFVSMCPLRLLPKIFLFDEEELVPELRAQRTLNKARIPEMARYMVENRDDYVFSAITASVDAEVRFEPLGQGRDGQRVGLLHIPMDARFVINDGQHRRAAIEAAMRENPDLADESIAVVFFLDLGLERTQQMFTDLNRYAVRPPRSLSVLYDYRDVHAQLAKLLVLRCDAFKGIVETERSSLALRSQRLFTLSAICSATAALIPHPNPEEMAQAETCAAGFWRAVAEHLPGWKDVQKRRMPAGEVRRDFIHSSAVVLQAIATAGRHLMQAHPDDWRERLARLRDIDWSRTNTALWEGRAMTAGSMSKSNHNVTLITNVIKRVLGIELTEADESVEAAFAGRTANV